LVNEAPRRAQGHLDRRALGSVRVPPIAPSTHLRDLARLGVDDVPRHLFERWILAAAELGARHANRILVMGHHRIDEYAVEDRRALKLARAHGTLG
jgi:hypothetical protein